MVRRHLSSSVAAGNIVLTHRHAQLDDVPAIRELMQLAIAENMKTFLSAAEIEAVQESMGVDLTLIRDQTAGRDDSLSDPAVEPARIRAMYTHPDWIRRGIGTFLLQLGETAARAAGFKTIELGSTVPGEPLYCARGYRELSRHTHTAANGDTSVVIKMTKSL